MPENKNKKIGALGQVTLVVMGLFFSIFTHIYHALIIKPTEKLVGKILDPLIDTLDDANSAIVIVFSFIFELLFFLIFPWFFNTWIGISTVVYLIFSLLFLFWLVNLDTTNDKHFTVFLIATLPYLTLLLLPMIVMAIFRKKVKPKPTIIELRSIKLKRLKRKIIFNKLKFWEK